MDQLREQVARARRRLVLEQFLSRLVWCLLAAMIVAAVALALPRLVAISGLAAEWDTLWLVGSLAGGLLAAVGWTLFSPRSSLEAALEIDQRFELRERVASSLSLSPEDQATEAGRALMGDAVRAVSRIDVDDKFRVRLDRRAWWPLVPAAIAFLLVTLLDNRQAASGVDPESVAQVQKQIQQASESTRKKLEEQRKQAEKEGLKAAEGLFKQLEEGTRELSQKEDLDRTKAAVKLNDLAKQLEERRQQLGGKEGLSKQLQNMKNLGAGPAEKAMQAMKQGDWQKALDEVEKLAKDLREGKLDEAGQKQLAQQLAQMKERLEAAAAAHQQAQADLQKQIEAAKQEGNLAKAGELQQKLDAMKQQQAQMDRMQQMAQQMGQAQQALQQGDAQKAADAMAQMGEQLQQMQQEMKEMDMLDAAMDQLQMAKDMMACGDCQGAGCAACQGGMGADQGMGQLGMGNNPRGQPGMGMGAGQGIGPRPDEKNDTNLRDTRVRQNPGQGAAVFGGLVEGPNIKGEVGESIKEEMSSLGAEPADPLTLDRLPNSRREHALQYQQMLRDGR